MGTTVLPAIAGLFAGIAVFFLAYAILAPIVEKRRSGPAGPVDEKDRVGKYVKPMLDEFMPQMPALPIGKTRLDKLDELIRKSGNPWRLNSEELVGIMLALGTAGAIVGSMVALIGTLPISPWLVILICAGGAGFYPLSVYRSARAKRTADITRNLPEALDLLTVSLAAGETFQPAIISVVKQLPDSLLREEFKKVALGIQSGVPLEKTLTDFAQLTDSEEADQFAKAIIQSQKLGSDVTETLSQQASFTRNAKETRLEEKIARLNTTLFIPLSLTMLPAFLIIFVAPIFAGLATGTAG